MRGRKAAGTNTPTGDSELGKLILCMHCHGGTDVAYNELCYPCYKTIGRMPAKSSRKTQSSGFVLSQQQARQVLA